MPGLPVYYATAMPMRRWAIPLLAETHQGRPTKLEGNPTYAPHGGATSLFAQASILDLYDPDRATAHTQGGRAIDSAAVKALLFSIGKDHAKQGGAGLAFLAVLLAHQLSALAVLKSPPAFHGAVPRRRMRQSIPM